MSQVQKDTSFAVVGLSKVVRNDDPEAIGALWAAFRATDIRAHVGADTAAEVYCVYHDYAGGFMDPYRMTIGYRSSSEVAPEGLHRAEIPAQTVYVYEVNGPQPQSLFAQWQAIWAGNLNRSYIADYDVYHADSPEAVSIRVGIQPA